MFHHLNSELTVLRFKFTCLNKSAKAGPNDQLALLELHTEIELLCATLTECDPKGAFTSECLAFRDMVKSVVENQIRHNTNLLLGKVIKKHLI